VVFRYCDNEGHITEAANPNGSINNIAGITNASRNVVGMMPHPERRMNLFLGRDDGTFIFNALAQHLNSQQLVEA